MQQGMSASDVQTAVPGANRDTVRAVRLFSSLELAQRRMPDVSQRHRLFTSGEEEETEGS